MPQGATIGVDRRTFLAGTGAAALAGASGYLGVARATREEVRFVLNPAEADVDITRQYQPMIEYLEAETGATIDPVETASYAETLVAIRDGHAEIADSSPSAAVAGEGVVDVVGIRVAFGAAQYFATITTTPEDGIEELADLEGELIYAGAPMSVSGTLVPLVMLQEAGLDVGTAPDGDPVDFDIEYGDHSIARNQLIQREEVAAACTGAFTSAPLVPQEQFDEYEDFVEYSAEYEDAGSDIGDEDADPNDELRLLDVSDPLPRAPIIARSDWDDPVREEVEAAILAVEEEDLAHDDEELDDDEVEELWFTGVEEGDIDDYEPIREVLDALDLQFEDLE
ncbi:PhnD/SsuA/transferrin family substrate-binding protein [Halovivax sp.]|uniref:PhnD/SsuA/transferrin family substrate-binding protein n=1 Tax=Halovivax sp. TaxID=1935978 RepID=UPI0025C18285|nr:PhnD/SsuA/transferrin family substrate-binding protein [Halovivax sp.]